MKKNKKNTGFSLIEILIIVVILVVVLGAIMVIINPIKRKAQAQDARRLVDVTSILGAVTYYGLDNNGDIANCDNLGSDIPADSTWRPIGTKERTDFTQDESCVAAWLMEGNANDSCQHHDGMVDGPSLTADKDGNPNSAYLFDGIDDYISIGDPRDGSLDFDKNSFTYMVRVYVTETMDFYDMPFYKGGASAGSPGFDMELGAGGWNANLNGDGNNGRTNFDWTNPILDRWVLLTAVVNREDSEYLAYVDDQLKNTRDIPNVGSVSSDIEATIGLGASGSHPFNGTIDEVAIFKTALNQAQIAEIYNKGLIDGIVAEPCDLGPDLAAYLPMMPEDPEEGDLNGTGYSGYEIKRDSSDTIYIRALHQSEYAEKDIQVDNRD